MHFKINQPAAFERGQPDTPTHDPLSRPLLRTDALAALVGLTLYTLLIRTGETTGPVAAAREQNNEGGLYGPTLIYRPLSFR